MYRASVGCIVFGFSGVFIIALLGAEGARLNSAFTQLNQLIPLGIIIGVMYEIRHSHGTRSINLPVVFAIVYCFISWGLFGFSKQGMLLPLVCWALPVCAMRYRLTALQGCSCLFAVFIIFHYLIPYADYGRNFRGEAQTFTQQIDLSVRLLEHPEDTRQKYLDSTVGSGGGYYNTSQGFWDRLQFISVDDGLINLTDHGHVFGLWPVKATFLNAIPHVIWPNKPDLNLGNNYMHEINGQPLDEGDTTTGISFSPTGEGYHWAKWVGILVVAPLLWLLLFVGPRLAHRGHPNQSLGPPGPGAVEPHRAGRHALRRDRFPHLRSGSRRLLRPVCHLCRSVLRHRSPRPGSPLARSSALIPTPATPHQEEP